MIRAFRSLCAKLLPGIVPAMGVPEKEFDDKPLVRRRVEVTVERESVSILVPSQPAERASDTGRAESSPEAPRPELPPPAPSILSPAVESSAGTASGKLGEGKP